MKLKFSFSALASGLAFYAGLLALSPSALAQNDPFGQGLGGGDSSLGGSKPTEKRAPAPGAAPGSDPNDAPESHAASGGMDSVIPEGNEPRLPEDPLAIDPDMAAQIGSDLKYDEPVDKSARAEWDWYGLYFREKQGDSESQTLFPFWYEHTKPSLTKPEITDRSSLYTIYYNRRSAELSEDILFPIFWNMEDKTAGSRTTIVGPFVNRRTPLESDDYLAPFYFKGTRKDSDYLVIPPLLSYLSHDKTGGLNIFGPAFCSWEGSKECDVASASKIELGVAPLFFYKHDENMRRRIIPPLLHYHYDDLNSDSWTDIWALYYRHHKERDALHIAPLYFSIWGEKERHTTLLPLFHYGYTENSNLLVTPLFLNANGADGSTTFFSWLYGRHRGQTELDMITPLYWEYREPATGFEQKMLFPFLFSSSSPRHESVTFFPFYSHSKRYGVSETTWVSPLFRHHTDLRGWSTWILPVFSMGRHARDSHLVLFPLLGDFRGPDYHTTIAFPLFWRFEKERSITQVLGNTFYSENPSQGGKEWEFHFFPFFSYGESPKGHWWNVLYGLAGYTREGSATKVRALWNAFPISN